MEINKQMLIDLADQHGAQVLDRGMGLTQFKLPNGATVSIGHGGGHYTDKRDLGYPGALLDVLPCQKVEVAYWHPDVQNGAFLPHDDVHAFTPWGEVCDLVDTAARLTTGE